MALDQFIRNIVTMEGVWYKKSNFLREKPGTQFQYSNLGAALAAHIVERVTGESFADYTDKRILKPIGMIDSAWFLAKIDRSRYATHDVGKMNVVSPYAFSRNLMKAWKGSSGRARTYNPPVNSLRKPVVRFFAP